MLVQLRQIECLSCGYRRSARATDRGATGEECPRCAYVGWAESSELTETTRRALRERPLGRRHLHAVS